MQTAEKLWPKNLGGNMQALTGQAALITGGGAIGLAAARALARDGAAVQLMARDADNLAAAKDAILAETPDACVGLSIGDAGSEADMKTALGLAENWTGRLGIVVATVGGGGAWRPIMSYEAGDIREILERNVITTFLAIRHGAARMKQGGSIVCISAISTKIVVPYLAAATTAKSAVEGLVRAAAEELAAVNIRVNAVRPGLIPGGNTGVLMSSGVLALGEKEIPLAPATGRVGQPEDVANAIRYLAGPESAWVTGQSFAVDGGQDLRKGADYSSLARQAHDPEAFDIIGYKPAL
jgi:NAD(P)-dependent dehydrogenase (short-subunit alcohol dehydrogenase family)